jgi:putative SbcD/Mre11-related phosphoesterase
VLYAQEGLHQAGITGMALHFLSSGPALVIENTARVLVIADLHIGIESDLDVHGVHIPSQNRGRLERVLACIEEGKPDLVLLLGDVKHSVPLTTRQEYFEIPALFREIRSRVSLKVVPGNHDGGLERFLEEGEMLPMRGALIDGVGYLHGHTYPDPSLLGHLLVIGHHHPMVAIRDEVGCALRDRAYLLTTVDEDCLGLEGREGAGPTRVLVMPAFNEFTGFDLTRMQESKLGPLSRCMDFGNAEVFLTDGTYLGLLGSLGEE